MSSSFSEMMEVKNGLLQQHIAVSEEWVEACIAFIKQEQGQNLSLPILKKSVYQQWLVADLEEIACASLPPQLPTLQKITLKNNFALQVQGIRDISKPAYSQLKQLEGTLNSNDEFTSAPKAAVPEWEAKPTRMLMFNLTDGCIQIQGMEYRAINFLSPNLHPGIKVLIKAPVECRFGVLLLQPENIRILGGEVESKLQQYSRENLLRVQLQLPTDEDQEESSVDNSSLIDSRQESLNRSCINSERPTPNNRNQTFLAQSNRNQTVPNASRIPNFNSNNNYVQRNQSYFQNSRQASIPEEIMLEDDTLDLLDNFGSDDDFEQNIDYDKIDEIENTQRQIVEHNSMPENREIEHDIWEEDEDVVRDMMEFQDQNLDFEMPFMMEAESTSRAVQNVQNKPVFTYLSTVSNNPSSDCVITIKGFIITVLSKLECTPSKGWNLLVKINDGTASIDASIHDKVLENIIGMSAQDMMKKQALAAKDPQIKKEIMEAVSKCKPTLQNFNCLMDVKFSPGEKPCIVQSSEISSLQRQQMFERLRSSF